jgi:hypothetical protein
MVAIEIESRLGVGGGCFLKKKNGLQKLPARFLLGASWIEVLAATPTWSRYYESVSANTYILL